MKYVILRDDDTNAFTRPEWLERLYRPFFERELPVNLAVIPLVSTQATYQPGKPEGFLLGNVPSPGAASGRMNVGCNRELVAWLKANPLVCVAQHGCHHETVAGHYEFDHTDRAEIGRRLDEGMEALETAGLGRPAAFVAPYDKLSCVSLKEVARRFRLLSTGWFELRRLPPQWWGRYLLKKIRGAAHWKAAGLILLSHPGCHLSYHRSYSLILQEIERSIQRRRLTVLVTHWWEYFRNGRPDQEFIEVLHQTAAYLAGRRDVRVISFAEVIEKKIALN